MFVSQAFAQAAGAAPQQGGGFEALLPLVLIFVVFYFLLIRPQQKKMKQHKDLLSAIRRGDRVVTGGGIIGTVTNANKDDELTIEIADEVRVKVKRSMVAEVLAKTEPVKGDADTGEDKAEDAQAAAPAEAKPEEGGAVSGLKKLLGGK